MSNEVKTITRKQLYDKVWSTPMTAIAKEYGLSDVGMAKLCKRHEIPRPPLYREGEAMQHCVGIYAPDVV